MFTGLVEATGRVEQLHAQGTGVRLEISTRLDLSTVTVGDSVAVDGVCLTAVLVCAERFEAEVSHETLRCTTLGARNVSDPVHLERAMRAGDRLGGHLVQGHVDCTGRLRACIQQGECWDLEYELAQEHSIYIVEKGSITVDGVSLTVNRCGLGWFGVTIVPHTTDNTHLTRREVGEAVNIETDIVGKYVVNAVKHWVPGGQGAIPELLQKHGLNDD